MKGETGLRDEVRYMGEIGCESVETEIILEGNCAQLIDKDMQ